MFILDTDHVSLFQRNHPTVVARVSETPYDRLATTVITFEEQIRGSNYMRIIDETGEDFHMVDELQQKRNKILLIADKYGAKNVRVFGSFARKENRSDSDIDFLIDMEGSLLKRIGLIQELEDLLGRKVDVMTEKSIHWFIREKVIKEALPL